MNKSRYSYRAAIEETIANAKRSRSLETVKASDGATVYAYPQSQGRIAWSVNARENGLSILRGPAARETSRLCARSAPTNREQCPRPMATITRSANQLQASQ